MADRRNVMVAARVTPAEHGAWQNKAAAAGVSPSALLRQAMARTRAGTAPALAIERERSRQVARIASNLNQLASGSLSTRALAVLLKTRALANRSGLVFPSARGRPLSDPTPTKALREPEIPAVPHGFRCNFRDRTAECSDAPRLVCERSLVYVHSERVEAACRCSDLFKRRRELMEQWAAS